jgi:tRNA (cytidine/uridine-2'-O-)-methyltransferase
MSYLGDANVNEYDSWATFRRAQPVTSRMYAFWDEGSQGHDEVPYNDNDYLVFGQESVGLPELVTSLLPTIRIEMPGSRSFARTDHRDHSLNLSVSVGIAVAESNRVCRARRE